MENIKVKDQKRGYGVNHKQHGYIQYRGLATKNPIKKLKMRIEINLTEEVAKAIQEKAEAQNQSRKSYIELLCINDVKKKTVKPKRKGSTDR